MRKARLWALPIILLVVLLCGCSKAGESCRPFEGRKLASAAVYAPEEQVLADLMSGARFGGGEFDTESQLVLIEQFLGRVELGAPCGEVPPEGTLYLRLAFEDGGEYELGAFSADGKAYYVLGGITYPAQDKQIPDIITRYCGETLVTLAGEAPRAANIIDFEPYYIFEGLTKEGLTVYFYKNDYSNRLIYLNEVRQDNWDMTELAELLTKLKIETLPIPAPPFAEYHIMEVYGKKSGIIAIGKAGEEYYLALRNTDYTDLCYPLYDKKTAQRLCELFVKYTSWIIDKEFDETKDPIGIYQPVDHEVMPYKGLKAENVSSVYAYYGKPDEDGGRLCTELDAAQIEALCPLISSVVVNAQNHTGIIDRDDDHLPSFKINLVDGTEVLFALNYGKCIPLGKVTYAIRIKDNIFAITDAHDCELYSKIANVYLEAVNAAGASIPAYTITIPEVVDGLRGVAILDKETQEPTDVLSPTDYKDVVALYEAVYAKEQLKNGSVELQERLAAFTIKHKNMGDTEFALWNATLDGSENQIIFTINNRPFPAEEDEIAQMSKSYDELYDRYVNPERPWSGPDNSYDVIINVLRYDGPNAEWVWVDNYPDNFAKDIWDLFSSIANYAIANDDRYTGEVPEPGTTTVPLIRIWADKKFFVQLYNYNDHLFINVNGEYYNVEVADFYKLIEYYYKACAYSR